MSAAEDTGNSGEADAHAVSWTNEDQGEDCNTDVNPVVEHEIRSLLSALPKNLNREREMRKQRDAAAVQRDGNMSVAHHQQQQHLASLTEEGEYEEEEAGEANTAAEAGLQNAWQYRKSIQEERSGIASSATTAVAKSSTSSRRSNSKDQTVFCHSYDLGGAWNIDPEPLDAANIQRLPSCCGRSSSRNGQKHRRRHDHKCGYNFFRQVVQRIESLLSEGRKEVVRMFLYRVDETILSVALPLILAHARRYEWPFVALVSVQSWASDGDPKLSTLLRRCCDAVLQVEGFAARSSESYPPPPEFRQLHGLLQIRKRNTGTAATANGAGGGHFADSTNSKYPVSTVYGLKRDRRKLSIQLLHIPPEDFAQGGGSVGGGVRSGGGRPGSASSDSGIDGKTSSPSPRLGCASSGGTGSSLLDF